MSGLFGRWWKGQQASGARVGGDLVQINGVQGSVVFGPQPAPDPTEDDFQAAYTAYAKRLRERYGRLDLEVLTPLHEQGEHPAVRLREIFVPQSVRADPPPVELPRDVVQRLREAGADDALPQFLGMDRFMVERMRQEYEARPALPVLEVLSDPEHTRLVLLGDPGAGKSTLARYLALALTAEGGPPPELGRLDGRLPLVVELRMYAEAAWRDRTFEDFLGHLHEDEGLGLPPGMLGECLAGTGPRAALVVFDGLDELFEKDVRNAVARRIAGFAAKYPATRVVVTSRRIGYQRAVLDGAGFTDFMLQDLDRERIGAFCHRWFALACPDDPANARRLEQRVLTAVDGSASVRSLAGNPLILTILAIIGRRRELPRDRRAVYEHAMAVLVEHWDPSRFLRDRRVEEHLPYLGPEDKLELLRLVARRMQEGEGGIAGNHIAGPDLIDTFETYLTGRYALPPDRAVTAARIMLDQFQHRNFVLSLFGGGVYGFVHRTFLEYLVAIDLVHRFQSERSVSEEELYGIFAAYWEDPAWHEILLLLSGLLDERFAGRAIDRVLAARPFGERAVAGDDSSFAELLLAAECLAEVRRPGLVEAQTVSLVRLLIRTVEVHRRIGTGWYPPADTLARTGAALRALGPRWPGLSGLVDWYVRDGQYGQAQSAEILHNSAEAMAGLVVALLAAGEDREAALRTLIAPEHTPATRSAALRALFARPRDGGPPAEEFLAFVRRLAAEDGSKELRALALALLVEEGPHVTPDFVRLRAAQDPHPDVRAVGLRLLAATPPSDRDRAAVEAFLQERARVETEELRVVVLTAMSDSSSESRQELVAQLRQTPSVAARRQVLAELMLLPGLIPFAGDLAEEWAVRDPDPEIRSHALRVLTLRYRGRPRLDALFRRRAVEDESAEVRATALHYLESHSNGDEKDFLLDRLRRDTAGSARAVAVALLAAHDDAETRSAVLAQAIGDDDPAVRTAVVQVIYLAHDDHALQTRFIRDDPSPAVRAAALPALSLRALLDPNALALLMGLSARDPHPDVRLPALRETVRRAPEVPTTLDLLADRAAHDLDEGIRTFARDLLDALRPEPLEP
ncbi:HEAT repeat domain-containing protein [Streptomyces lichenis]|uniref:HEAT repeat domain-containing protein n=1 Tax=Streptomyces lichenis TaxID=2306967 RepID=A0ABT0IEV2_9ACTN|nr:HEAT repeat domain-containing protein [Streptomyces lichenis]MCK8679866.1 HEAT repeat domain-containing protein [Streptomyces lichenis]